ncbi:hypothetical protein F5J12DRAFT_893702 [Pisolithus orientalis]|uniref:uncharacterized protein n=1 Tax=Pisolithus orientalis TaxID=936130 RepID=UPI0022256235|nr:uncharacterized protein F5J12DRAFT_893702 [Pisolithus orientalis]KAI6003497.1 hypothetical protein F5J12DRAFT_893702 [Pisolithus orientalis]
MATAGLTTKAMRAESVWNMHQAWFAHTNLKTSEEDMQSYYSCHTLHYGAHKDEEEYPELWDEICEYWKESASGTKDMSSKVMVGHVMTCGDSFTQAAQTWCNVRDIHVFGCVIYSGNDEAACQALGIFAGSPICMELASERQTDITRLLDYLATIVKYKILDPVFMLKSQESRHDHNRQVLPQVFLHKLYEVGIMSAQRNTPWKSLLNLLYMHQYTIVNWPAAVSTVGPDFNIKGLSADKLCALTVPFLKEQMGADFHSEVHVEDEGDDSLVPVPMASFDLREWTPEQKELFKMVSPEMFEILLLVNTFNQPLCILSDLRAFIKPIPKSMGPSDSERTPLPLPPPSPPVEDSLQSLVCGSMGVNAPADYHHSTRPSSPMTDVPQQVPA